MELLILLIVLILLMPGLLGVIFVPLLLAIGIILVVQLLFHSVATVLLVPRSLLWVAFNKRVRQNHALEHATVNVIEEKFGRTNLSGYAVKDGFKLFGSTNLPPELIYQAAQLGLERLKSGEKELAIHNRCGSSLLITNFLFAVLVIAAFVGTKLFRLSYFILALVAINFLAKPLGRLTQKWITTSTDVRNVVITQLEVRTPTG
ncbi:hypothetical protein J7M23_09330, partial [Candidatus Sumerlaeota bacterium]|nr:hypothetical protein [Candidatus Sumerlaeota bacterium]